MAERTRLACVLLIAGVLLAGCFQPSGVEELPSTAASPGAVTEPATSTVPPIALTATVLATPTDAALHVETVTPTDTPSPALTASPEIEPTATPTLLQPSKESSPVSSDALRTASPFVIIVTATPEMGALAAAASPTAALQVAVSATATPTVEMPTLSLTPAATLALTDTPGATAAQVGPAVAVSATASAAPTLTPFPGEPPRQANGCPIPVEAMALPPNRPSYELRGIPEHIDYFLYSGGTIPQLEAGLRAWGVLIDGPAVATGFFDANNQPDVALAVQLLGAGQPQYNVWVFNCLGRVLYQAFPSASQQPTGVAFVEVNGRMPGELFYTLRTCTAGCITSWHIIQWVGPNPGDTIDLLRQIPPLGDHITKVELLDLDGDGVLELRYTEPTVVPPGAPPERDYIHTWRLAGQTYVEAPVQRSAPVYRHQYIRAADEALAAGDTGQALQGYERAINDTALPTWPEGDPSPGFIPDNAFARYRYVQVQLLTGQTEAAEKGYTELIFLYPEDTSGDELAAFARAFWESYRAIPAGPESRAERMHKACLDAVQSGAYAGAVSVSRQFGLIAEDAQLCPF